MSSPRDEHVEGVNRAIAEIVKSAGTLAALRARIMVVQGVVSHAVGQSQSHAALEAKADLADIDRLIEDIHARLVNAEDGLEHYKQAI
jgi:hypothetical protein